MKQTLLLFTVLLVSTAAAAENCPKTNVQVTMPEWTQEMLSEPQSGRMIPNMRGDKVTGFRFSEIQSGSMWDRMGFKVGDVITTLNGQSADSPARVMELYTSLKGRAPFCIGFLRDGKSLNWTFNFEEKPN